MKTKCTSKVLSLILVMLILIGMTPAVVSAAQPGETSDGYKYSISNGEVTITGYTGESTVVNIPESIENCPVTKVSSYAFIGNTDITDVVYPKGVTAVEAISFANCTGLQSIHLRDTVTTIGASAFFGCTKLVNISIPQNVEVIGISAFQKCEGLTNITLPDSVKSIGGMAFAECTKLKTINIPEGVTTIAGSTFEKCTSLKTIKIPATVTSIDQRAFSYCSRLSDVYFNGTSEQWDAVEFGANNGYLGSATIHFVTPEKITIRFKNSERTSKTKWENVMVYYWGSYGKRAAWPGVEMPYIRTDMYDDGFSYDDIHEITLPAGTEGVIFHNNDNIISETLFAQRLMEIPAHISRGYYLSGLRNSDGTYRLVCNTFVLHAQIPNTSEGTENPTDPTTPETTVDPSVPEEPTIPEFTDSPETVPRKGTLKVEVEGGTGFSISVNGGVAKPQGIYYINTKMTVGTSVTLVAKSSASSEFYGWVNGSGELVSASEIYTFVTSGNDTLKAVYMEDVVGVNSVSFVNEKAAGGRGQVVSMQYYAADDKVVFPATPVQVGYDFAGWSMTEAEIQSELLKGKDVTVTANWTLAKVYVNLTVNGGKITYGNLTDGKALAYNGYGVTADTPPAGKRFAYWVDATGRVMSYDTEFKFYPATDIELTAVYVDENNEPEYEALVTIVADPTVEGEKIAYTLSWDVSHVGEIVAAGITLTNEADYNENTLYHGTDDKAVFDREFSQYSLADKNTYSVVKSGSYYENTYAARAWVVYKDASGTNHTVHSDVIMVYKPAP